ncbi:hypothetical protein [Undibacterium sp. RuRC25W]|uniref:hypothetical protein n=1 Tax=Undibacterium sp. RuRC25W TaxID=3413047 RepID=UPI003BEF6BB8
MPLNQSNSKSAISANIKQIVDEWKQTGRIGTSHPRTKMQAVKQAVAVALSTADNRWKKKTTSLKK